MKGAIIGDIIGSVHEGHPTKREDFSLFVPESTFTDDTVLTIATADALLNDGDYGKYYWKWGRKYSRAGFGAGFYNWLYTENNEEGYPPPYNSWGNGAAMRVSPVAFAFKTLEEVEQEAEKSAAVSHNHPEGIKGAKAVAAAIFLAKENTTLFQVRDYLEAKFEYDLSRSFDQIRATHHFDVSASGSIPPALIAFFASQNFEDAVRKAISLGGDADTQACMAGAVAHAYYKDIPAKIAKTARNILTPEMRGVMDEFTKKFQIDY